MKILKFERRFNNTSRMSRNQAISSDDMSMVSTPFSMIFNQYKLYE
jgi:hypothetical protein